MTHKNNTSGVIMESEIKEIHVGDFIHLDKKITMPLKIYIDIQYVDFLDKDESSNTQWVYDVENETFLNDLQKEEMKGTYIVHFFSNQNEPFYHDNPSLLCKHLHQEELGDRWVFKSKIPNVLKLLLTAWEKYGSRNNNHYCTPKQRNIIENYSEYDKAMLKSYQNRDIDIGYVDWIYMFNRQILSEHNLLIDKCFEYGKKSKETDNYEKIIYLIESHLLAGILFIYAHNLEFDWLKHLDNNLLNGFDKNYRYYSDETGNISILQQYHAVLRPNIQKEINTK